MFGSESISRLRVFLQNAVHAGAAHGAFALGCLAAVLHSDDLFICHISLCLALNAICCCCHMII